MNPLIRKYGELFLNVLVDHEVPAVVYYGNPEASLLTITDRDGKVFKLRGGQGWTDERGLTVPEHADGGVCPGNRTDCPLSGILKNTENEQLRATVASLTAKLEAAGRDLSNVKQSAQVFEMQAGELKRKLTIAEDTARAFEEAAKKQRATEEDFRNQASQLQKDLSRVYADRRAVEERNKDLRLALNGSEARRAVLEQALTRVQKAVADVPKDNVPESEL